MQSNITITYQPVTRFEVGDPEARIYLDEERDDFYTEHWEQFIENYLPSGVAHLFFFDGEQIEELADAENSSKILETAIHSLLGLELIKRLDEDLKILERFHGIPITPLKVSFNQNKHIRWENYDLTI